MSRPRPATGSNRHAPLDAETFNALMAGLGPFEARPRLAVGVSGGADSMALALLADGWAKARGGRVVGITVDHGLRPESVDEAVRVGRWLAARGIEHHVVRWTGDKPETGIQERARRARRRLLEAWCRDNGVLHLLLAHHRDDQAETVCMRLMRGSGVEGLAAMAPVRETAAVRLLRPLLDVPAARLRATLGTLGQDWIEDPSNEDTAFERVRVRRLLPLMEAVGLGPESLVATARKSARDRTAIETAVAEAAAQAVHLHPAGFARVDAGALGACPRPVGVGLLRRLLAMLGGRPYLAGMAKAERLYDAVLREMRAGATLGGCRVDRRGAVLMLCREAGRIHDKAVLRPGETVVWDGRFRLSLAADAPGPLQVAALGEAGWRDLVAANPALRASAIPYLARLALPVVCSESGVTRVPYLTCLQAATHPSGCIGVKAAFSPPRALGEAPFSLAVRARGLISEVDGSGAVARSSG